MMSLRRALLILSILLVILALHEAEARGSRSRKSSSTSRIRKTQRRSVSSSNSKPKLQKTTFHSPVTHSRILTKKKPFNTRFIAAAATGVLAYQGAVAYKLFSAPVYSGHYRPYYETSNIVIPKHRALRIEQERYHVEKKDSSRCLNGSLSKHDGRKIVNVTTKISYEKAKHVGAINPIPPSENTEKKQTNLTVSSDAINNYVAKIEIRIAFNQSILTLNATESNTTANTTIDLRDCKIMVYRSTAYLVESFAFRNEASFILFLTALFIGIIMN